MSKNGLEKKTTAKPKAETTAESIPVVESEKAPEKKQIRENHLAVKTVIVDLLNVRKSPSVNAPVLRTIDKGTKVTVKSASVDGWAELVNEDGFVMTRFLG